MQPMVLSKAYTDLKNGEFLPLKMINFVDNEGWTLAHYAAALADLPTLKKLHLLCADLGHASDTGKTPADLARNMGAEELAIYIEGCVAERAAHDAIEVRVGAPAPVAHPVAKRGLGRFLSLHRWTTDEWALGFGRFDGAFEAHLGRHILRFAPEVQP